MLLLDVDGVLTDGSVTWSSEGYELKTFHVRDGLGLRLWQQAGNMVAIITGRASRALTLRTDELGASQLNLGVLRFECGHDTLALLRRAHAFLRRQSDHHFAC